MTKNGEAKVFLQSAIRSTTMRCIIWPFAVGTHGYGVTHSGLVHVRVLEASAGPRPSGADVAHSCGKKLCCNPAHIRWASRSQNEIDKVGHGRSNRGERHGMGRLTRDDIFAIRRSCGTHKEISVAFGISQSHVTNIINHKAWAWL